LDDREYVGTRVDELGRGITNYAAQGLEEGLMRVCLLRICTLALGVAAPSAAHAQRMATAVVPPSAVELRVARFASLGTPPMTAQVAMRRVLLPAKMALPAVTQADSFIANDTRAQTGAIIGGFVGAVGGGLAAAHFTHRAGATNSTTGTLGGAVVGAGLIGTLGALVGLVIGSSIHE
jgi:hypothetical protein